MTTRRAVQDKIFSNVLLALAVASVFVYRTYDPRGLDFAPYFAGCVTGILATAGCIVRVRA